MLTLQQIARAIGGRVAGNKVLGPGPGHSSRDRSLKIKLDPNAPDGFLVHSFARDDWALCKDYLREKLGLGSGRWRLRRAAAKQGALALAAQNYCRKLASGEIPPGRAGLYGTNPSDDWVSSTPKV
jgi:hypothetical protein